MSVISHFSNSFQGWEWDKKKSPSASWNCSFWLRSSHERVFVSCLCKILMNVKALPAFMAELAKTWLTDTNVPVHWAIRDYIAKEVSDSNVPSSIELWNQCLLAASSLHRWLQSLLSRGVNECACACLESVLYLEIVSPTWAGLISLIWVRWWFIFVQWHIELVWHLSLQQQRSHMWSWTCLCSYFRPYIYGREFSLSGSIWSIFVLWPERKGVVSASLSYQLCYVEL